MNVLMISIGDNILSNPIGDALERQLEYAKALGHIDMIVYSPKKHNLQPKYYKNLSIYPTKSINMFSFIFDVLKITNDISKKKKIDVITTQDPFGTALAGYFIKRKYDIPLHIQNHSSFLNNPLWIQERPLLFNIFNKIAHFTLKKADRLRVVNTEEKRKYIDILGIKENKIDVAPVPINVEFWQKPPSDKDIQEFVEKYNIDLTKPILSWIGRPVKSKNLPYLFKSVFLVNKKIKTNLLIAGDMKNSYWNLEELEQKFNIKPIYLGLLTHQELKIMYYISTLYLHTSNYEGFGLVVSDAQSCGTVVISRNTAGTRDIIENNKSGILVNGDENEFAKCIIDLLDDNKKLDIMSKYSKEMMRVKFNRNKMFENIINSIKKACKKG